MCMTLYFLLEPSKSHRYLNRIHCENQVEHIIYARVSYIITKTNVNDINTRRMSVGTPVVILM